jgi:hypothetical protein
MKNLTLLLFSIVLIGCSSSERIPLSQVQTKRVYKVARPDVFEAVRFFAIREQFRLDSFEEETGRVIGHKVQTARRGEEAKTIIMNLRILEVESGVTEVNARFTYYIAQGVLKKDEEADLVDCYVMLFDVIAQKEK